MSCVCQAGEALGAIGSAEVLDILREYTNDPQTEVHVHAVLHTTSTKYGDDLNLPSCMCCIGNTCKCILKTNVLSATPWLEQNGAFLFRMKIKKVIAWPSQTELC